MIKLKVPSIQHLARNWNPKPTVIGRRLVQLALSPPTFNYEALYSAVRDLLLFEQPYEQVVEGIRRGVRRPAVRDMLLDVLPLLWDHFHRVKPDYYQSVARRYYSAARGLMVPFDPPLIYGVDGQIWFPWFSFWRRNPLENQRLSLFVTIVEQILLQDPDLENAKFQILDFSASGPKLPRQLKIIEANVIRRLSNDEVTKMLSVFAEGYRIAQAELNRVGTLKRSAKDDDITESEQPDLFGEDR